MYSSAEYVHDAFAAGADAYVSKASASRSLIEAMYAVRRGELYADAVSTRALLESVGWLRQDGVSDQRYASLSQREREVFFLIAKGRTTKEIARRLDVSTKTVETHRASIYAKLDVSSPVAIARYAAQLGLV
jgi:DNA-binding NarL/FixJ family response regulator